MAAIITKADLAPFAVIDEAKADAMIADAVAMAALVAPCITDPEFPYQDAARAILRGALLRWNDSGSGAAQTVQSGPFSQTLDTRQTRRGMFWPSEIEELQRLCSDGSPASGAFAVDTAPTGGGTHGIGCSLMFGATYCSCGADLTGYQYPIFGG